MIVVERRPSSQAFNAVSQAVTVENDEPISYIEAINSSDAQEWLHAMDDEMGSIHQNDT